MKQLSSIIFLLFSVAVMAQQEAHYTHFMYNQQLYNPAYVGSRNTASFTGLHRSQWLGFEGAPYSEVLSFQTPIMRQRAGVGATISRYAIGVSYTWFGSGAYSYNLRITQNLSLRLGLQATIEYFGVDFSDPRVVTVSQNDPSLADGGFSSKYAANVGLGMYLTYKDMFYFGASSPQIYPNDIGFNEAPGINAAQISPHRYFNLGAVIPVTEQLEFMPNIIVKWVDQAPLDGNLNFNFRYMKKITAGLSYGAGGNKAGDSVSALMFFQFNQKLGAGLSYDFSISDVREYQSGSIEVMLRYDLRDEKADLENPRYFKKK